MTATLLVQIAAKATLVLVGGWAVTGVMGRASAAARHLVWVLTLTAALAVPGMHAMGPAWTLEVLPAEAASARVTSAGAVSGPVEPWPSGGTATTAFDTPIARDLAITSTAMSSALPPQAAAVPTAPALTWGAVLVRVWLAGMVVMLVRLVVGIAWANLTVRRAHALHDTGWLDSLDEAAAAVGLTRSVEIRVSAHAAVPMATGFLRAVVLLPPSAIDWPEERRRVVLQHELAHVKRRDCLLQALAQCVSAVHWFNPAAHLAVARLRAEQERACDDLVIAVGTDARSYAAHLFEIARSFRAASFPTWVAMSMARPSQLEGRMLAILDGARVRCAPSASLRAALMVATLIVAVPLGALRLAAQTAAQPQARQQQNAAPASSDLQQETVADSPDLSATVDHHRPTSIDIVHGDRADVDLLDLAPAMHLDDAVTAAIDNDAEYAQKDNSSSTTSSWKWTTVENGRVKVKAGGVAGAGAAAQNGTAVSDETRRRVADALISALSDDNPQVRQEALSSLASMRDERAIPGLIRALNDPIADVRMRALGALVQFNSAPAVDGLLAALKDRSADVRELAARHLASMVSRGQLNDPKYVDAFSALLKDENADVREQAVVALGRMRTANASAPLTQALRDSSADVRQQAARSLAQLGSADAVPSIIALLKDPAKDVREQAAVALGSLADPRAIDPLTAALKDAEPSVREEAARALGQIARGQRRGVRPGAPIPPIAPVPPLPPRAFAVDEDRIREMTERAQEAAERAQRDVQRQLRDLDRRFDRFTVPSPTPVPDPAPVPAPPR